MKVDLSKSQRKLLHLILAGSALFFAVIISENCVDLPLPVRVILLTAAYIILGHKVLLTALRNIKKAKFLTKTFLCALLQSVHIFLVITLNVWL